MTSPSNTSGSSVKVAVRIRPLNSREVSTNAQCVIYTAAQDLNDGDMQHQICVTQRKSTPAHRTTSTFTPNAFSLTKSNTSDTREEQMDVLEKRFSYDHAYSNQSTQQEIYNDLGKGLLHHAFDGYNSTIMAYGQTGSGKTHTMFGQDSEADRGLMPRICQELFEKISELGHDSTLTFHVQVSYMEIYCERVMDLLSTDPTAGKNLRVREHPTNGPYVADLIKVSVSSYDDILKLMERGNIRRTTASTNMNETSSRSHAVFTIILTQCRFDEETQMSTEKSSRLCLVDLAGSERANATGATGGRLKEGANINQSLTTLGKVISALAERSNASNSTKIASIFVPYRDSVLTWLLKDSLGGNSKTSIIATVSPADTYIDESLSTLRYADRAKKIINKAVVNEDPNARLIRELKAEVAVLRSKLSSFSSPAPQIESHSPPRIDQTLVNMLRAQLEDAEKNMRVMNETWHHKLLHSHQLTQEREKAFGEMGIVVNRRGSAGNMIGVTGPKNTKHLLNLSEDIAADECLVYSLKTGRTLIVNADPETSLIDSTFHVIALTGSSIEQRHCIIITDNSNSVTIAPISNAVVFVNGQRINTETIIDSGSRIILGDTHEFRYVDPSAPNQRRPSVNVPSLLTLTAENQRYYATDVSENDEEFVSAFEQNDTLSEELRMTSLDNNQKPHISNDTLRTLTRFWKTYRYTSLVRRVTEAQNMVKEACIISHELQKTTRYCLAITSPLDIYLNATSFWDSPSHATDVYGTDLVDTDAGRNDKALRRMLVDGRLGLFVNVLDSVSGRVRVWSLEKLSGRLQQMRQQYNIDHCEHTDKDSSISDPFSDGKLLGQFEQIGYVDVCLLNLFANEEIREYPLVDWKDRKVVGHLSVSALTVNLNVEAATVKQPLVFEINIRELTYDSGTLNSFDQIHCQYYHSAFDRNSIEDDNDRVHCTNFGKNEETSVVTCISLDHTQHIKIPPNKCDAFELHKQEGVLRILIFGKWIGPAILSLPDQTIPMHHTPTVHESDTIERRNSATETNRTVNDRSSDNVHDINAWVEICELAPSGDYTPVPVQSDSYFSPTDPGAFMVRQGVQRRLVLSLIHDSGHAFPWLKVSQVRVSNIRRLDRRGQTVSLTATDHESYDLTLRLLPSQQNIPETREGKSLLWAEASWDSSLHESMLLNRITNAEGSSAGRVVLTLSWYVDVEGLSDAVCFETDVYLQVHARDAKHVIRTNSSRLNILSGLFGARIFKDVQKMSSLFQVSLNSSALKSEITDIASSSKYVRGQEFVDDGDWKMTGKELFDIYFRKRRAQNLAIQVWHTRHGLKQLNVVESVSDEHCRRASLETIVDAWRSLVDKKDCCTESQLLPSPETIKAQVRSIPKPLSVAYRGYLKYPERPGLSDKWIKRWFVVRRPVLYIYQDSSEQVERGVIVLTGSKTQWDLPELEQVLSRRNVFCLYTQYHGYLFQAENAKILQAWLGAIDPLEVSLVTARRHSTITSSQSKE